MKGLNAKYLAKNAIKKFTFKFRACVLLRTKMGENPGGGKVGILKEKISFAARLKKIL